MAFGSNDFPLGPNGKYPKQRVSRLFGNSILSGGVTTHKPVKKQVRRSTEEVYKASNRAKLPAVEKEYSSSVERAKGRMKVGQAVRKYQSPEKFRPDSVITRAYGTRVPMSEF